VGVECGCMGVQYDGNSRFKEAFASASPLPDVPLGEAVKRLWPLAFLGACGLCTAVACVTLVIAPWAEVVRR